MLKVVYVSKSLFLKFCRFILSVKLLMYVRFLSGFYQQFTENLNMIRFLTAMNILMNTFLPIALLWLTPPVYYFKSYCEIFEHYMLIFVSIYTQEEYFADYISGMHRVEATMRLAFVDNETTVTRFVNLLMYFRIVTVVNKCYKMYSDRQYSVILPLLSSVFVGYSKDVACIPILIMLEIFRHRIRVLRLSTEECLQNARFGQQSVRSKLLKIKKIVYIYKNLFNVLEEKFNVLKFMVAFKFATDFRVCMIFVHGVLSDLIEKKEEGWSVHYPDIGQNAVSALMTVLPPLLFELSADEVDSIKAILADQLLTCPEPEVREALHDALTYMRVRRLRCVVWRVFDIDGTAPLTFLALVTNYVTVMIQFMKPQLDTA